jgi:hypothetical protein
VAILQTSGFPLQSQLLGCVALRRRQAPFPGGASRVGLVSNACHPLLVRHSAHSASEPRGSLNRGMRIVARRDWRWLGCRPDHLGWR